MVCPAPSDHPWLPFLGIASGLVAQGGGILSHVAILCRELGLPAVIGIPDALARIRDGQTVEVDGARGVVTLLPPATAPIDPGSSGSGRAEARCRRSASVGQAKSPAPSADLEYGNGAD